jgi:putative methyltransferase (TIGR04325 family)
MIHKQLRTFARLWLPPVVTEHINRIRGRSISFDGPYSTWDEAHSRCTGYAANAILARVLEASLKVARGEAVWERDSVTFDHIEYSWPVTAGLMWAAARSGGRLAVLDFGGALGSSWFQHRNFLSVLPDVRWDIVEQPHYVAAGREHLQAAGLCFWSSIEDCAAVAAPNVVLLSGVLQCIPDPQSVLTRLTRLNPLVVILDRVPYVHSGAAETILVQKTPAHIYPATYPCRFFSEESLIQTLSELGYELVEVFPALDRLDPRATWKGHILTRCCGRD